MATAIPAPVKTALTNALPRLPRSDNRLPQILDAAAALFAAKGYQSASIRDIVKEVGMLPGSLYYHFANKEDLLVAVYGEGVRRISAAVRAAAARESEPWARLEAACASHFESLVARSPYAKVVISVQPADVPAVAKALIGLRDGYEKLFVDLIAALPLPAQLRSKRARTTLRMLLLGALNWAPTWYKPRRRPGGASPRRIAHDYIALLKADLVK